jgi:hypothetical protein
MQTQRRQVHSDLPLFLLPCREIVSCGRIWFAAAQDKSFALWHTFVLQSSASLSTMAPPRGLFKEVIH